MESPAIETLEQRCLLAADPIANDDSFEADFDAPVRIGTVGFDFEGATLFPAQSFGLFFNGAVAGHFEFDPGSAATHSFNGTGYLQQRPNGFTAVIGGIPISADEYVVFVANDLDQPVGPSVDAISITFQSNLLPPLAAPLMVAGVPHGDGLFTLNLIYSNAALSDESLPTTIDTASFSRSEFSFLGDNSAEPDVFFSLTTVQEVAVAAGVLTNDTDADGDPLTVIELNSEQAGVGQEVVLLSGALLTLNADGSFDYDPNGQFGELGAGENDTDSFQYTISDGNGGMDTATVTITVNGPALQVASTVTDDPSTIDIALNGELDAAVLNLYDGPDAAIDVADVSLVGESHGEVRGTLLWNAPTRTLSFTKTGGPLLPDTYTLNLAARADGIVDLLGRPLDGDADGAPGGDFVTTFEVVADDAVVVSIPDFARGPGQDVDLVLDEADVILPVILSDGFGVRAVDLTIEYDPALLTFDAENAVRIGRDVPNRQGDDGVFVSAAVANTTVPGVITIAGYWFEALAPGEREILQLVAAVPEEAPLGATHTLRITNLVVAEEDGEIPSRGDDAVHAVAYLGDATASSTYSGLDASLIARVTVGLDTGFDDFSRIDPLLIGDASANGRLSALDSAFVGRTSVGLEQPEIPDLPELGMLLAPPPMLSSAQERSSASGNSGPGSPSNLLASWDILAAPTSVATDDLAALHSLTQTAIQQRGAEAFDEAITEMAIVQTSRLGSGGLDLEMAIDSLPTRRTPIEDLSSADETDLLSLLAKSWPR